MRHYSAPASPGIVRRSSGDVETMQTLHEEEEINPHQQRIAVEIERLKAEIAEIHTAVTKRRSEAERKFSLLVEKMKEVERDFQKARAANEGHLSDHEMDELFKKFQVKHRILRTEEAAVKAKLAAEVEHANEEIEWRYEEIAELQDELGFGHQSLSKHEVRKLFR